jgi:hypothetical protein
VIVTKYAQFNLAPINAALNQNAAIEPGIFF